MADFNADLNQIGVSGVTQDSFDSDPVWFGEAPPFSVDSIAIGVFDVVLSGNNEAFLNLSFELPASQSGADFISVPDYWTESTAAFGHKSALFGPPYQWAESYEALWSGNEDILDEFVDAVLSSFVFGSGTPTDVDDLLAESYERDWSGNQNLLSEFASTSLTDGTFNDDEDVVEGYERQWFKRHVQNDTQRITDDWYPDDSDLPRLYSLGNEVKAKFEVHRQDTDVHTSADTTNTITAPDSGDEASIIDLANDLWDNVFPHMIDAGDLYHLENTGHSEYEPGWLGSPPVTNTGSAAAVIAIVAAFLNAHFRWTDNASDSDLRVTEFRDAFPTDIAGELFALLVPHHFYSSPSVETYELGWRDNEDILTELAPGDLSDYQFTTSSGSKPTETYDDELAKLPNPPVGSYTDQVELDKTGQVRVTVAGSVSGLKLQLQTKQGASGTFVTRHNIDALPATVDLPEGTSAFRYYVEELASGSFEATLLWKPIETM